MNKKLGLVQIFRGIAAIIVVLCHVSGSTQKYFQTSFLDGAFLHGYIGVDFFFVLSGFIITYVHFKDLKNGSNKISFIKKRFIRIYPFYWIMLSVYVLLLFVAHGKTTHLDHVIDFYSPKDWAYIINSYLLIQGKENPLLGVTWTLTYEVLFYIVFFIGITIKYKKAFYLFWIWTALVLLKTTLSFFYELPDIMLLNVRIIEFLSGCVVAYLILKSHYLSNRLWLVLFITPLIFIYTVYPSMLKDPIGILLLSFFMGLLVYKIVSIDLLKEKKYSNLLLLLGEASYSIYLSHLILLSILLRIFQIITNKFQITGFIALQLVIFLLFITIILGGVLINRYVEIPVLRFFNKKLLKK